MAELYQFGVYFLKDLREPIGYLKYGIAAGLVVLLVTLVWSGWRKKWLRPGWYAACFLLAVYGVVVLWVSFLGREPGSRSGISWIPLETWGKSIQGNAYVVENVLMFLPFGCLLPPVWSIVQRPGGYRVMLCGFLCSCMIETAQLITGRGYFQVDDIITNTLGTVGGYGIYKLSQKFYKKRSRR